MDVEPLLPASQAEYHLQNKWYDDPKNNQELVVHSLIYQFIVKHKFHQQISGGSLLVGNVSPEHTGGNARKAGEDCHKDHPGYQLEEVSRRADAASIQSQVWRVACHWFSREAFLVDDDAIAIRCSLFFVARLAHARTVGRSLQVPIRGVFDSRAIRIHCPIGIPTRKNVKMRV